MPKNPGTHASKLAEKALGSFHKAAEDLDHAAELFDVHHSEELAKSSRLRDRAEVHSVNGRKAAELAEGHRRSAKKIRNLVG